ncbi:sortase [Candidatus Woesebacteria bacterium]|nr:sortase [Candidatus Woesebacteria bacterium]
MANHLLPPTRKQLIALYRQALLQKVDLDVVERTVSEQLSQLHSGEEHDEQDISRDAQRVGHLPALIQFGALVVPIICILLGSFLVGSAALPIAMAYFDGQQTDDILVAPIPEDQVLELTPLVISQERTHVANNPQITAPRLLDFDLDYTNLTNWFPATSSLEELASASASAQATTFTIEIPKLKIENASVAIGGTDLNKSLIAFPGTALPGEYGAPVVFGHSVLRQFYNPNEKNPRRYNSIFSTIMTLQSGDEIYVTYDNIKYTYIVQEKTEVKPTDVYILNQKYDAQRLKLVTCTPEGTYLRRGVVTAQMVRQQGV